MQQYEPFATVSNTSPNSATNSEVHSIPCKFCYTGPANVSSYFVLNKCPTSGTLSSNLRGHGLEGALVSVPSGYELAILKQHSDQGNLFAVEQKTTSLHVWEWDRTVGERTSINKAFSYLPIAQALAADD